jgi:transcription antitermination factor NusG
VETRWAVLRTQPRREALAARAVKAKGIDIYLPQLPRGQRSRTDRPLFPGYLFAHVGINSDDVLRIRSVPGVAYVLPRLSTPVLLSDGLIEAIQAHERALRANRPTHSFRYGDHVRVRSGPFKWVEGLFDRRLTAAGRVRILLEMTHGTFTLQIGAADVELVGASAAVRAAR